MRSRVILADDHPIVIQGVCDTVARTSDLEIVATAMDGLEAENCARTVSADLLVLDVGLPGKNGIKVLETMRASGINMPVLFFSMYPADQYAEHVRLAGAQGFVSKDAGGDVLIDAMRRVAKGGTAFACAKSAGPVHHAAPNGIALSPREHEVLDHLLRGDSLVSIAEALAISPRSVSTYRRRILDKMNAANNAELIRCVQEDPGPI